MSPTLTVSGTKRETHLLKNGSDIHTVDEIKNLFPKSIVDAVDKLIAEVKMRMNRPG